MDRQFPLSVTQSNTLRRGLARRGDIFPLDYFATLDLRVVGPTPERIVAVMDAVCGDHDACRTRIRVCDGEITQVVVDQRVFSMLYATEPGHPTDLGLDSDAPLVRAQVWPEAGTVRVRLWAEHTVSDGESLNLIAREVARRLLDVRVAELGPTSFPAWSAREHEFLKSVEGEHQLTAWRELLGDEGTFPAHPLWTESSLDSSDAENVGLRQHAVTAVRSQDLMQAIRRRQATPATLAFALLGRALHGRGPRDVVIHTPVANRRGAYRDTIGWLAHGLPLRLRTTADIVEQLQVSKRALARSLALATVPLPAITARYFPDQTGATLGRRPPRLYVDVLDPGRTWHSPSGRVEVLPDPWPVNHGELGLSLHLRLDLETPRFAIVVPPGQTARAFLEAIEASIHDDIVELVRAAPAATAGAETC